MPYSFRHTLVRLAPGLAAVSAASAGELTATIEIPRLDVAEYHRPYVAIWIETPQRGFAANLAVWYDVKMANDEGETWLKDIRQWWRKSGRELDLPIDGLSGPTRPVGVHELKIPAGHPALAGLAPGDYELVVEASREVGGRELVRVPFSWGKGTPTQATASGQSELGAITLRVTQP